MDNALKAVVEADQGRCVSIRRVLDEAIRNLNLADKLADESDLWG